VKRIILGLVTILLVSAGVYSATQAYFSDTETSTGNTFTAGTIDLTVGGKEGTEVVHVVKDNMKPQPGYTYQGYNNQFMLKNVGNLPGVVSWKIKNLQNFENGCNEPESASGDVTCGTNDGELGQYTWVKWSENDTHLGWAGSTMFNPLNTADGVTVTGPTLAPGQEFGAYMWLDFPYRTDNLENRAQSDSMSFDIEFTLTQEH
jgi:predicted ribosomally synthesized peptide with SipW-like signal peptide